jgi:hypothetical protein
MIKRMILLIYLLLSFSLDYSEKDLNDFINSFEEINLPVEINYKKLSSLTLTRTKPLPFDSISNKEACRYLPIEAKDTLKFQYYKIGRLSFESNCKAILFLKRDRGFYIKGYVHLAVSTKNSLMDYGKIAQLEMIEPELWYDTFATITKDYVQMVELKKIYDFAEDTERIDTLKSSRINISEVCKQNF